MRMNQTSLVDFWRRERLNLFAALALVGIGIGGRLFTSDITKAGMVTLVILLAAAMLRGWYSVAVPLCVMFVTDFAIGNSVIYVFTWSAWLGVTALGLFIRGKQHGIGRLTLRVGGVSLLSAAWFFLWTNFGVWVLGFWGPTEAFYPLTTGGLLTCYVAGLPFLGKMVVSNLLVVPLGTVVLVGAVRLSWIARDAFDVLCMEPFDNQHFV